MVRGISMPIGVMTRAMLRLAENDLEAQINGTGRGDEIGSLAKAAEVSFELEATQVARFKQILGRIGSQMAA
jgi:methyl-accepting chemotaxis protein